MLNDAISPDTFRNSSNKFIGQLTSMVLMFICNGFDNDSQHLIENKLFLNFKRFSLLR